MRLIEIFLQSGHFEYESFIEDSERLDSMVIDSVGIDSPQLDFAGFDSAAIDFMQKEFDTTPTEA